MFIAFNKLPDQARVWIYQANEFIKPESKAAIEEQLISFTASWTAHGQPLQSSFSLLEDHFIVLAVDENFNGASGCSIDHSTNVMKHISEITGIDFFNRKIVAFEIDQQVRQFEVSELKQKFKEGILNKNTTTFNTLADSVGALRQNWRIPVYASWLKRYIETPAVDSVN